MISEYNASFQYGLAQSDAARQSFDGQLLSLLQAVEDQNQREKLAIQHQVQEQISSLRSILQRVDSMERGMDEPRYHQFRQTARYSQVHADNRSAHSREDINAQVDKTIRSIERVTNSIMPKTLAAICSFFNPSFRYDAYRRISEERDRLEQMIVAAEYDIHATSARLQSELSRSTISRVQQLQVMKNQADAERVASDSRYFDTLKKLLLDGLEEIICGDTVYSQANNMLSAYTSRFLTPASATDAGVDSLVVGMALQALDVSDDGTLDHFLSTILKDGIYKDNSIILPISLRKYFPRPICVTYHENRNECIFPLFQNYAIQMLDIYREEGVSVYLVDCANLGAGFSTFTSVGNEDEDARVIIVRTTDELKSVLESLSEYMIESNASYLRNIYRNIEEYNQAASTKREIQLLFISNISELASSDMLNTLFSIIRNGSRCGVHSFIAISNNEYQMSNITTQSRVSTISSVIELCDRLCMGADGSLSFGNGLPQLLAPPAIQDSVTRQVLHQTVTSKAAQSVISFADHMLSANRYFTENCDNAIDIPVGLDAQGNEYVLHLSKDAAYMLVGGNPSCGKSSLIHTIILQCITRYSPERLQLYLADLKDGSEFDIYAQRGVKSVCAVLDDAETDIASGFLRFIQSNVEMRLRTFEEITNASGKIVKNIEQFYEVNNKGHYMPNLPRILLIIDEFQSLYNSSRETGEITNWLVRMCRTVGISIIMASQRAQGDTTAVANSFGHQTKEYFVYRGVMKLPFSGAREIMSEHCSDTNRENPALRRAQMLKVGQLIINSNMGATEADNQFVQCFYPDNDIISSICDQITARQGKHPGIILNSERATAFSPASADAVKGIALGESNYLFYDMCNPNADAFIDNFFVAMDDAVACRMLVVGSDKRVAISTLWSAVYRLSKVQPNNFVVNILGKEDAARNLIGEGEQLVPVHITADVESFLRYGQDQLSMGHYVLNTIISPADYESLRQDTFSDPSDEIQTLKRIWNESQAFTIVICDQYSKIKDDCSYCDAEIPYRLISVGNIASIRAAMTLDAAEKVNESPFNTVRPNVIKAYYYNKLSDKVGRCRLFDASQMIANIPAQSLRSPDRFEANGSAGYTGLRGN